MRAMGDCAGEVAAGAGHLGQREGQQRGVVVSDEPARAVDPDGLTAEVGHLVVRERARTAPNQAPPWPHRRRWPIQAAGRRRRCRRRRGVAPGYALGNAAKEIATLKRELDAAKGIEWFLCRLEP